MTSARPLHHRGTAPPPAKLHTVEPASSVDPLAADCARADEELQVLMAELVKVQRRTRASQHDVFCVQEAGVKQQAALQREFTDLLAAAESRVLEKESKRDEAVALLVVAEAAACSADQKLDSAELEFLAVQEQLAGLHADASDTQREIDGVEAEVRDAERNAQAVRVALATLSDQRQNRLLDLEGLKQGAAAEHAQLDAAELSLQEREAHLDALRGKITDLKRSRAPSARPA